MPAIVGQIVLVVYGIMLAGGGYMGYAKAGSKASLIAGASFGVVALLAAGISKFGPTKPGLIFGAVASVAVMGVMISRFVETKKFMPAGMTAVLSLIVLVMLAITIFSRGSNPS